MRMPTMARIGAMTATRFNPGLYPKQKKNTNNINKHS